MSTQSLIQHKPGDVVSDRFDPTKSYAKDELCIYGDELWKFTSEKAAGVWDSSKVMSTKIDDEMAVLKNEISSLNASNDIKSMQLYREYCVVYKRNGIVTITGTSSDYPIEAGKYVALTTLPEGFRPPTTVYMPVNNLGGTTTIFGRVESNGIISLYATEATKYWAYSFSFAQMY